MFWRIIIYLVFIALGIFISRKLNAPKTIISWLVSILIAILIGFIGINTVFTFFGYLVELKSILIATFIGIICGFLINSTSALKQ